MDKFESRTLEQFKYISVSLLRSVCTSFIHKGHFTMRVLVLRLLRSSKAEGTQRGCDFVALPWNAAGHFYANVYTQTLECVYVTL